MSYRELEQALNRKPRPEVKSNPDERHYGQILFNLLEEEMRTGGCNRELLDNTLNQLFGKNKSSPSTA